MYQNIKKLTVLFFVAATMFTFPPAIMTTKS